MGSRQYNSADVLVAFGTIEDFGISDIKFTDTEGYIHHRSSVSSSHNCSPSSNIPAASLLTISQQTRDLFTKQQQRQHRL